MQHRATSSPVSLSCFLFPRMIRQMHARLSCISSCQKHWYEFTLRTSDCITPDCSPHLCALQAEHELLSTASSKNSEQLDSHDLRIMALEKTSYSGTFVWKISGFQNALEAAVKNEKVLLAFPVCE